MGGAVAKEDVPTPMDHALELAGSGDQYRELIGSAPGSSWARQAEEDLKRLVPKKKRSWLC
jgi:hypothetical protein